MFCKQFIYNSDHINLSQHINADYLAGDTHGNTWNTVSKS